MKRCLNIGSGSFPMKSTKTEKWINLDKDYYPGIDAIKDCSRGLPFDQNYFDSIFMGDVIEHLTGEEIEATFSEIYRVCKHGAKVTILTPHWSHPSSWGDFTHKQHFSEWLWEHMQSKVVIVPGGKKFIFWRFNIEYLGVKEGRITCVYTVWKKGKYKPTKVEFSGKNEV